MSEQFKQNNSGKNKNITNNNQNNTYQSTQDMSVHLNADNSAVVDDIKSFKLARDIREKIENELTYPGQIKVTVIRETRATEIAK